MRVVGLIGGVSWLSTIEYYRIINETVAARLGGHHSAKLLMSSLDLEELEQLIHTNQWKETGAILIEEAIRLEQAGADFLLIASNTFHKLAPEIQRSIEIPLLHIAQVTAEKIQEQKIRTIGLLGTRFTMNDGFYQNYMERFEIKTLVPQPREQDEIHNIIFTELSFGVVKPASLAFYQKAIQSLIEQGAQGIVLGCTEIPLLVQQQHVSVPVFDTTRLHAEAAAEMALRHARQSKAGDKH